MNQLQYKHTLWFILLACPLFMASSSSTIQPFSSSPLSFDSIIQFGDSLSDTGNLIRQGPAGPSSTFAHPPYGQTYFHHPTGRCSDGQLMVDFIATYFGLPLLNPYLARGSDFSHGVNLAVAGATALTPRQLKTRNVSVTTSNSFLASQMNWFKSYLNSTCSTPQECKQKLGKALVLMGEIGGNDFNFAFFQGRSLQQAYALVPDVILTVKNAVEEVIELGAVNVVVPGNFPIGCVPVYLVRFETNDKSMYDELGCLKPYNDLALYYNNMLQQAIQELQHDYPHVAIVYGDYFNALKWVITQASTLGFEKGGAERTCCASGNNTYNYDPNRVCGSPGVEACSDPTKRVSWDGIHMTQQGNKFVANFLLRRFVPQLRRPIL